VPHVPTAEALMVVAAPTGPAGVKVANAAARAAAAMVLEDISVSFPIQ
jgi:hypothetical protein